MKLLEMNHIKKEFDGLGVLKDISLAVEEGEIVSIIGPSGSGKSTMLRCATMLEEIDGGEILYMGKKAAWVENGKVMHPDKKEMKEIRSCFGLVFQNFNLFPHYSVLKNIADAPIHVQKRNKDEVYKEAMELLKKMGLEDKADAYPFQLSGGQCQRVAIARALALNPKILFFDEPTSALDPELTGEVLKVIKSLADLDITMVINTRKNPWTINSLAEIAGRLMFPDEEYIQHTRELISGERDRLFHELSTWDSVTVYEASANFILIKIRKPGVTSQDLFDHCIRKGLMIRDCSTFPFLDDHFVRFCVMLPEQNERLLEAFREVLL